jgi:methylated-DNA-[protein]-cysteine S-methyltransferase
LPLESGMVTLRSMSSEQVEAKEAPSLPVTVEPVRVLVPSQIGQLGVEFYGLVIGRILIAPGAAATRNFHPLSAFEDSEFLDEVFGRLSEYFAGARRALELDFDLGPSGVDSFSRRVLKEALRTPYGKTRTYKDIADASGRPEAYRQVLSILLDNPLPLIIPCHRIIPTKEGTGNWVGGASRKRWLLRMERESAAQTL